MHIPITTRAFVRKASSGIVVLCEFLGVQIAWFPNLWFISPALLFIWCLIQVTISIFLLLFVVEVGYHHRGEFTYIANIALVCIMMQIIGFFDSLRVFGAAVALTNTLFLYVHKQYHSVRPPPMGVVSREAIERQIALEQQREAD